MKKQLLAILFVACLTSAKSQVFFGASFGAGITGKAPAGAATLGVDFNHFLIQGGFHSHLSAKQPTLYRLTAGRSFEVGEMANFNLTAGIGRMDRYFKGGKIMTGKGIWVASVEYAKDFKGRGQWFVESSQSGKYNFATVGLKFFFVGSEKYGCPASW